VISLAELYEGVYCSRDPERNEQALNNFLRSVTVIGIDEDIGRLFGRERGRMRAAGKMIRDFDLLIGATALQLHLTLLTTNRRHFELIEGLQLVSL
jgi:tRNA(fMet)-specific endonuclease VapC